MQDRTFRIRNNELRAAASHCCQHVHR